MKFSLGHIATLCKYTGISFIAGAVTHGAFSEQQSMITSCNWCGHLFDCWCFRENIQILKQVIHGPIYWPLA